MCDIAPGYIHPEKKVNSIPQPQASTLLLSPNPKPYTLNPETSTLKLKLHAANPAPKTPDLEPFTVHPTP